MDTRDGKRIKKGGDRLTKRKEGNLILPWIKGPSTKRTDPGGIRDSITELEQGGVSRGRRVKGEIT